VVNVPQKGQVLKYRQTGELFEVRKIVDEFVILHSRQGISQILTGIRGLFNSFDKIPEMKGPASTLEKFP
jgi:hypothetical protein